jgi:hypothetical protein
MKLLVYARKRLITPAAIILAMGSIIGIVLSSLAIITGLLGTLFVYLYPGRPYAPPPTQMITTNASIPTAASTSTPVIAPTITPTYIPPTFMGPQRIAPASIYTSTPIPTPTPMITIELINITSPIGKGSRATLTVKTLPGKTCNISYTTPLGTHSTAQDLITVTADQNGLCSWTWTISNLTKPGTGAILITVGDVQANYLIEIVDG